MVSAAEFFRLSLSRQCTLLGNDGFLLGIRRSGAYSVKLYMLYDFLVEVFFEHNGWVSTTSQPSTSLSGLYPGFFAEA